ARIAGFSGPRSGIDAKPGGRGEAGSRLAAGFGANDLKEAREGLCPDVLRAAAALDRIYGNSRMTGSGSAVFARAGSGPVPSAAMPGDWPSGWSGRMCRSLESHPLAGWARRGGGEGLRRQACASRLRRGVAKLVKASDFDSDMRGFESFLPCQIR